jgi:hypothetical protein
MQLNVFWNWLGTHWPLFKHGFGSQTWLKACWKNSHRCPWKFAGQMHLNVLNSWVHTPPLRHVFGLHNWLNGWVINVSHLNPWQLAGQLQLNEFKPWIQVPPFWHGFWMQNWLKGCCWNWLKGCTWNWFNGCCWNWLKGCWWNWLKGCTWNWLICCCWNWLKGCCGKFPPKPNPPLVGMLHLCTKIEKNFISYSIWGQFYIPLRLFLGIPGCKHLV